MQRLSNQSVKSVRGHNRARAARRLAHAVALEPLEGRRLFAAFVVNTVADTVDADPAVTSLREALAATAAPGDDTVSFDPVVFSTPQTITLTGGQLTPSDLAARTTIAGPGADLLTISGINAGRVVGVFGGATLDLSGVTVTGGNVDLGGGLGNSASTLTVTDAVVTGNTAFLSGGGVHTQDGGTTTLARVTISNNRALLGGGVSNVSGVTTLVNATVTANNALLSGGGVYSAAAPGATATTSLTNSTVARNTGLILAPAGGGIFAAGNAPLALNNTIVSGNSGLPGTDVSAAGGFTGTNNFIGGDAVLGPLQDNGGPTPTIAPLPGSPVINAGSNALVPPGTATDQRGPGFPRALGGTVDVGAVEFAQTVAISDVSLAEGNSGVTQFAFTVTRNDGTGVAAVDYATSDLIGTPTDVANAGFDYNAASGSVVFRDGETSRTVTVGVRGDADVESDQAFAVNLSNPLNATIVDAQGIGTILNDDVPPPSLSVNDVAVTEGNSGTKNVSFTVSLDRRINKAVTVKYATAAGSAAGGTDFVAKSGTLSFPAFSQTAIVTVQVGGDAAVEADETLRLVLSAPTNAAIAKSTGVGTILNDDAAPPTLSIADAPTLVEGDGGTKTLTYTVRLSAASSGTVTVKYATADGTAKLALNDYKAKRGTLTFAPGETVKTITVTTVGDTRSGPDETVFVNLSGAVGASILDGKGVGTIKNDD